MSPRARVGSPGVTGRSGRPSSRAMRSRRTRDSSKLAAPASARVVIRFPSLKRTIWRDVQCGGIEILRSRPMGRNVPPFFRAGGWCPYDRIIPCEPKVHPESLPRKSSAHCGERGNNAVARGRQAAILSIRFAPSSFWMRVAPTVLEDLAGWLSIARAHIEHTEVPGSGRVLTSTIVHDPCSPSG